MTHKKRSETRVTAVIAVSLTALFLSACSEDGGTATGGRVVSELASASCLPSDNGGAANLSFSAEKIVDGVAFGWICMGNPDAPVTMVEFASLTCPHCANFHNNVLPDLKKLYVDTGKVKLVFGNYVFNPYDMAASMVVRCGGPNKAFPLLELFFRHQSKWYSQNVDVRDELAALARQAGMNRAKFDACLDNSALQKHLEEMRDQAGGEYKVNSTPTFFINGEELIGAVELEKFQEIIDSKF